MIDQETWIIVKWAEAYEPYVDEFTDLQSAQKHWDEINLETFKNPKLYGHCYFAKVIGELE